MRPSNVSVHGRITAGKAMASHAEVKLSNFTEVLRNAVMLVWIVVFTLGRACEDFAGTWA
jgi:hypothetical protein